MADAVELLIEPRRRPVGAGHVRRLLPFRLRRMVGPFIFCDLMGPEALAPGVAMKVDAHPHIGLSTLTYLVEGRAVHRDSTGAVQTIEAGAVNWMTAGAGVTHTERSHPDDVDTTLDVFGAQLWVALPTEAEDGPPGFEHCPASEVPWERSADVEVKVVVGSAFGMSAPITGSSPLALVDLTLDGGAIRLPTDQPERAVVALSGHLRVDGTVLPEGSLAVVERDQTPQISGDGRALVLAGEPVGDRHIWWNFVHSDPEAIEDAKARWEWQRFPLVPDDHDEWVPLPG